MSNESKRSEDGPPNPRQNSGQITPFESIRRTDPAGNEFWSSCDLRAGMRPSRLVERHGGTIFPPHSRIWRAYPASRREYIS
jgi:hypothetical protein